MNHLYFGDNLSVMQEMSDNTVDYCYADPPFGTGRNYNVFLHAKGTRSQTQTQAYTDTLTGGKERLGYETQKPKKRIQTHEQNLQDTDKADASQASHRLSFSRFARSLRIYLAWHA